MFNVTVIRLKDIIKYPVVFAIIMIVMYFATRYFFNENKISEPKVNIAEKIKASLSEYSLYPIETEMPIIEVTINAKESTNEENESTGDFTSYMLNTALKLQLGVIDAKEVSKIEEKQENIKEEDANEEKKELQMASKEENTKVVTKDPIEEKYTNTYNGVKVRNGTKYSLTKDILNPKNLKIDNSNVLIFHTHTCESYTQSEGYTYKASGNFRTRDQKYSVCRVGDELESYLTKYKFNVIHNKTYHDYPAYNGSYSRSLSTVKKILKKQKSDIIIDLHRDAIGSNSSYAPTVKIGNDYCAQLMFVMRK